jgi:hypothetical protein
LPQRNVSKREGYKLTQVIYMYMYMHVHVDSLAVSSLPLSKTSWDFKVWGAWDVSGR